MEKLKMYAASNSSSNEQGESSMSEISDENDPALLSQIETLTAKI